MKLETLTNTENNEILNGIISKIRDHINYKNLEPGDKLPSERMLSEKFEVSRTHVREAIQKLEFYGILNSRPQSGTFISDIGQIAMNGMIDATPITSRNAMTSTIPNNRYACRRSFGERSASTFRITSPTKTSSSTLPVTGC